MTEFKEVFIVVMWDVRKGAFREVFFSASEDTAFYFMRRLRARHHDYLVAMTEIFVSSRLERV